MEEGGTVLRRWEDIDSNILMKIAESFDLLEFITTVAQVCRAWRMACSDPALWKTLDLSHMKSNFIKIPLEPYVYVNNQSDRKLTRILKGALNLSRGNTSTLIFHVNLYITDKQFTYTAERCPRLKRLVMPAWNRIKKTGICRAIYIWKDLESLTMPSIGSPDYVMENISKNCKRFAELKIMGSLNMSFPTSIVKYLPNLRVLSLRCSMFSEESLVVLVDGLKQLEVLNISHCHIVDVHKRVIKELDESILKKASRLRQFFACMSDTCIMCQRTKNDEGLMRWYKYEEDAWRLDEVQSLAL